MGGVGSAAMGVKKQKAAQAAVRLSGDQGKAALGHELIMHKPEGALPLRLRSDKADPEQFPGRLRSDTGSLAD